jgi:hypothetical protein
MMKERRCVLTVADSVASNVIESIRRNREENSVGWSVNKSTGESAEALSAIKVAYPMLEDVLGS